MAKMNPRTARLIASVYTFNRDLVKRLGGEVSPSAESREMARQFVFGLVAKRGVSGAELWWAQYVAQNHLAWHGQARG